MRVEFAVNHLLRGQHNGFAQLWIEPFQLCVGLCRRPLDDAEATHHGSRLFFPADLEIRQRALRLRTPITVGRNFYGAECICFNASGGFGHAAARCL